MAYCRFFDGDVYLFKAPGIGWICCACELEPMGKIFHDDKIMTAISEVKEHLQAHVNAGHDVPQSAIDRVGVEVEKYGSYWNGNEQPFVRNDDR